MKNMRRITLRDGSLYIGCCEACPCSMMLRNGRFLCKVTIEIIDEPNEILDSCRLEVMGEA
jgi:hypothetical protein